MRDSNPDLRSSAASMILRQGRAPPSAAASAALLCRMCIQHQPGEGKADQHPGRASGRPSQHARRAHRAGLVDLHHTASRTGREHRGGSLSTRRDPGRISGSLGPRGVSRSVATYIHMHLDGHRNCNVDDEIDCSAETNHMAKSTGAQTFESSAKWHNVAPHCDWRRLSSDSKSCGARRRRM